MIYLIKFELAEWEIILNLSSSSLVVNPIFYCVNVEIVQMVIAMEKLEAPFGLSTANGASFLLFRSWDVTVRNQQWTRAI